MNISDLRQLYRDGQNIMEYLRRNHESEMSVSEMVRISYDLQAGSYVEKYFKDPETEINRAKVYSKYLGELLKNEKSDVLEIGIGEGTSAVSIFKQLGRKGINLRGFDISLSRIAVAQSFFRENSVQVSLACADACSIPLADNAMDLIYTIHCLEPNRGQEHAMLSEIYRVAKKYVVLFEPSNELANREAAKYIEKHKYVLDLVKTAKAIGFEVLDHQLLFSQSKGIGRVTACNTAALLLKKVAHTRKIKNETHEISEKPWTCPKTKHELEDKGFCLICNHSGYIYPKISNIPILLKEHAVLMTRPELL